MLIDNIPLDDPFTLYFIQGQEVFDLYDAWFVCDKAWTKGIDIDGGPWVNNQHDLIGTQLETLGIVEGRKVGLVQW